MNFLGINWLGLNAMGWVHEISQSALAAAVVTLGLVMLLELRSIGQLRRGVEGHLARVFEQLDLLRFESQQLAQAQTRTPAPVNRSAAAPPTAPGQAVTPYTAPPLGASEARLLAALTAARSRLGRSGADSPI